MKEKIEPSPNFTVEDATLIKAFQAGDKRAFDELVLRYQDRIYNLCFRFFGDPEEANDSAQDVFLKAYRSLKKFRSESSFSTWLYRIAVNTCKNRIKSLEYRFKKRLKRLAVNEASVKDNASVDIADDSRSPAVEIEKKERSMIIQNAINTLPEAKKTMVLLRDIEGLSYDEIAQITGFNLGTVKSKLARARSDLRKKLKGVLLNGM